MWFEYMSIENFALQNLVLRYSPRIYEVRAREGLAVI